MPFRRRCTEISELPNAVHAQDVAGLDATVHVRGGMCRFQRRTNMRAESGDVVGS
jgi:hypothetical protein